MQTTAEAPAEKPQTSRAPAGPAPPIEARALGHGFGDLDVLADLDLQVGGARSSAWSAPRAAASRPCSS